MPFDFTEVFRRERDVINFRRRAIQDGRVARARAGLDPDPPKQGKTAPPAEKSFAVRRTEAGLASDGTATAGRETIRTTAGSNLTGLALSGGGMRSASFCLGVLQALDALSEHEEPQILDALDYISAVSGGGYIGTSLVAGLLQADGSFPFDTRLDEQETPEVQHLRDFSNFLAPNGIVRLSREHRACSARPARQRRPRSARSADPRRRHHRLEPAGRQSSHARLLRHPSRDRPHVSPGHPRTGGVHDRREPCNRCRGPDVCQRDLHVADVSHQHAQIARKPRMGPRRAACDRGDCRILRSSAFRDRGHVVRHAGSVRRARPRPDLCKAFSRGLGGIIPSLAAVLVPSAIVLVTVAQKLAKLAKAAVGEATWTAALKKYRQQGDPLSGGPDRAAAALGRLHLPLLLGASASP